MYIYTYYTYTQVYMRKQFIKMTLQLITMVLRLSGNIHIANHWWQSLILILVLIKEANNSASLAPKDASACNLGSFHSNYKKELQNPKLFKGFSLRSQPQEYIHYFI